PRGPYVYRSGNALQVGVVPRVDLDDRARFDELRYLDDEPRLELGWLGRGRGRRALHARLHLDDLQRDRRRELDGNRIAVVEIDRDDRLGEEILHRLTHDVVVETHLVVRLLVHEMVPFGVGVEVLHLV